MSKDNIRSFRYDDEVAKIIEGFKGESYNEKFDNLVRYCFQELPKREKCIRQAEAELSTLEKKCAAKRAEIANLNQLEMERRAMQSRYANLMDTMQRFADKADEACNTIQPGCTA